MAQVIRDLEAIIQEFRVVPSVSVERAIDASWRVEIPPTSRPFEVKYQIEIGERNTGPWVRAMEHATREVEVTGIGSKIWAHSPGLWVRLLVLGPYGRIVATSNPMEPAQAMTRREFLQYRFFLYQENLHLRKAAGVPSIFIPRIVMDCPCPRCADEILGGAPDSNCPECYGTGVKNGYHPAMGVWMDWSGPTKGQGKVTETQMGPVEVEQKTVRMLPLPVARSKDIVIDPATNSRYVVVEPQPVNFKVWTVAQLLALSLLPKTDPAYRIPIPTPGLPLR